MTLRTDRISLSYGDGDQITYALRDVTLAFPPTGFFGIMGPSGSGKSSLLYLLSGLKNPTAGSVHYGDMELSKLGEAERARLRRREFGFVFQQPFLLNYLTAEENVLAAAPAYGRKAGVDIRQEVSALLEELHIGHLAKRRPAHLSGGERQRLVVARSMINRPSVIFADEPTAALDHTNGRAVIELLRNYRTRGAVIVVTHDPIMLEGADQIFHLIDGSLTDLPD